MSNGNLRYLAVGLLAGAAIGIAVLLVGTQAARADPGDTVSGGGQLVSDNGWRLGISGFATDAGGSFEGDWRLKIFAGRTPDLLRRLDGTRFVSTAISRMVFFTDDPVLDAAVEITMSGELDRVPGYTLQLMIGDAGPRPAWTAASFDAAVILIFDPDGALFYDAHGDFVGGLCTGCGRYFGDPNNVPTKVGRGNFEINLTP